MTEEKTSRGEQTRDEIITAAHRLFIRQGFHGTSMRQIAQKADIAVGGLYNHFDGKEDIFVAVLTHYHPYHEVLPALEAAQGSTIEELVRDSAEKMLEALAKRPDFMNLMFIEIVEFNSTHIQQLFETLFPRILSVVQRFKGVEGGKLRPIPPEILIRMFLGLFFSYYITDQVFGATPPPMFRHNALEQFVDIYLHGILAR